MIVKNLKLKNYRNYKDISVSFAPGLNVLVGDNAQGKTNLVEAIFLCAIGKSLRTNKDKDLILWNTDYSKIDLTVEKMNRKTISLYLFPNQNKAIKINNIPIKKMGELMGEFNAVYFCPDELKLIKDSPQERRRFMDIDLSQFDKNYFYALSKYNKILLQRNKLLKSTTSFDALKDTLSIWDEQLAKVGSYIIYERIKFVENLKKFAHDIHLELTNNKENLTLEYVGILGDTVQDIKDSMIMSLTKNIQKDWELGYTTVGPHRDDIKICINDIDVRYYGSQGQQRTSALSLKLAELEIFYHSLGQYPVLLLDDVLSELDQNRQLALLKRVSKMQTILTCTDFDFPIPYTRYEISNGTVKNVK